MQVGMVFALIFAIIMIGFIFIFGLPQIGSLISIGTQAQVNKMIKDIDSKVDDLYWNANYGSSEIIQITLPSDVRFCFIDPTSIETLKNEYYTQEWRTWRQDDAIKVMIVNEGYNLWYYKDDEQNGYKVNRLKPDGRNFCVMSGMELYMENKGSYVGISLM